MHNDPPATQSDLPAAFGNNPPAPPSPTAQSWGVVISITIIVLMIIIGAYYSWNHRALTGLPVVAPASAQ